MNWYLKCVKDNYANFSGRARRKEFWMYALINGIICLILSSIPMIVTGSVYYEGGLLNAPYFIYCLAVLIPNLAVLARRFHDIGKSGFYYLWVILPIIGGILVLYWLCKSGDKGINKYGPDPKSLDSENEILDKI